MTLEFNEKDLQMIQYSLRLLEYNIKLDLELPMLKQAEFKQLKKYKNHCKNLINNITEYLIENNIPTDVSFTSDIAEISEGVYIKGMKDNPLN